MKSELFTNRLPDPGAFPSMLQSMAKDWPLMHQLISSCVQQDNKHSLNELHSSAQPLYQIDESAYYKVKIWMYLVTKFCSMT